MELTKPLDQYPDVYYIWRVRCTFDSDKIKKEFYENREQEWNILNIPADKAIANIIMVNNYWDNKRNEKCTPTQDS